MSSDFIENVKRTVDAHGLLRPAGGVIVAVSGGADSVALLVALSRLGYDCVAAHCNFHLRGEESNRDMHHVEDLCRRLDIDLYIKDFDVAARRKLTGESLEMACRELRYKWFYELLDRDCAQAIAVGHHREDQVETFFLNLMRGAGVLGLAGMRYRNEHIVRPLLDVSRLDIENFLRENGIDWVDDSTNASADFARNRIRNILVPELERLFPASVDGILRTMSNLRENAGFLSHAVNRLMEPYMSPDRGEINLEALAGGEPYAAAMLFEYLRGEGFNRTQTDDMLRAAARSGGAFAAGDSHLREVDHGILRAPRARVAMKDDAVDINPAREIFAPVHIRITHHDVAEFAPVRDSAVAYLDSAALEGSHKWQLRRWRRGDRMTPYGMSGSKLVSDIMAAGRLSAAEKQNVRLLTRDGEILWVVGLRASASFAVGPDTRRFIRLELVGGLGGLTNMS